MEAIKIVMIPTLGLTYLIGVWILGVKVVCECDCDNETPTMIEAAAILLWPLVFAFLFYVGANERIRARRNDDLGRP